MAKREICSAPQRKHISHDVIVHPSQPTIVYVTVCAKDRQPWLATHPVHDLLRDCWREAAEWLVGRYVVMPDHIHLFCAPTARSEVELHNWVTFWKSRFTKSHRDPSHRWQTGMWDTRLRHGESYAAKWEYVRNNPVRHGYVARPEDWPYQGELNVLEW